MNLHRWVSAALFMVAVAACGPAGAADKSAVLVTAEQDRAGINKIRNEYVSAWKSANADEMAKLYTEDALVLYSNQPAIAGRSAILAYFKSFFARFRQEVFELTSAEIEVAGPWAFDRGTYRWRGVPRTGGDAIDDNGKYLVILKRQPDGSWKVARDMDNSDRPLSQTGGGAEKHAQDNHHHPPEEPGGRGSGARRL